MAKALPKELRERALREREGLSIAETAARFMVGTASVKRWNKRKKSTGSVDPSPVGGIRYIWIGDDDRAKLVALVEGMPDATIEELRAEYNSRHNNEVSPSSMHRALQRFDLTRKKSPAMPARPKASALSPLARPTPRSKPQ